MQSQRISSRRSIRDLLALWSAAAVAASAWAAGLHEEGYMLEAGSWHQEVARAEKPDWPVDRWYRISPAGRRAVDVRLADRRDADGADPEGSIYVRVPGTELAEGRKPKVRFAAGSLRPRVGVQYEMQLGSVRFSFTVESGPDGTRYDIAYDGTARSYLLGLPAAATRVDAIADFDGDTRPDFLVRVGDETYLLLSAQSRPGANLPSAQLWAVGS